MRLARKAWLLAGASWAALACWSPPPASAADYTAANETELQTRVAQANADGDPSSTITLTGPITLTDPAASLGAASKPLVINTGVSSLTVAAPSGTVSFSGSIAGNTGFSVSGANTIILTGNNTYIGGSTISAGATLQLAAGGRATPTNTNIQGTGTLTVTGAGSNLRATSMTVGNAGGSGVATLNVSDGGVLTGINPWNIGTVVGAVASNVTITGGGQISTRIVTIGSASASTAQGTTLLVSGSGSAWTNEITLGLNQGSLSVLDGGSFSTAALNMARVGNAAILVSGAGSTFTASGAANLGLTAGGTGILTVAEGGRFVAQGAFTLGAVAGTTGVLNIGGAEGTAATAAGGVEAASLAFGSGTGRINFNHTDAAYVFAPAITGAGTVNQAGPGTTILTGNNTYTGTTTIAAGTLQLGNGGTNGSIVTDVANNGVLAFNRSDALTYAGIVSGSGAVQQAGTGTTILIGANSYTGGTTISAGTLQLGNGGTTGSIQGNVANNGTLAFNRSDSVTFAGTISGSGALRQDGAGMLILTADNSFTGGTTIASGTLQLGNGGTTGSVQGNVVNNGTLIVNRSGSVTLAGAISGSGALVVTGGGTVILTGENSYTGGTTIASGSLQIGNGGTTGSIQGNILNESPHTLVFNRSNTLVVPGAISGIGAVRQEGTGTTIFTGANTYSGATAVNAGSLQAGAAGAFSPASAFTVAAGARLDLAGISQTIAGLTNAGLVTLRGAPGTALTVNGNYVGNASTIAMNTVLGGDSSATDRLVISGGSATGSTGLRIANIGGTGTQTVQGIRVVETQAGATTAAGAFRLDTRLAAGAYEYQLFRGSSTDADSWYLRSAIIPVATSPDQPGPTGPAIPLYRPEVPLYAPIAGIGRQMGLATLATIGTLHERVGEEENIRGLTGRSPYANGAWARAFGERSRTRWEGDAGSRATGELVGLQAGFDILRTEPYAGGHRDHAGAYAAYTNYNAPSVSGFALGQQGLRVGRLSIEGPSVGAYWTHFGPSGWYVDAVFQANWFDVKARSDFGTSLSTSGTGYAASLEAGYPISFAPGWQVEPQAQIVYQSTSIDRASDAFSSVNWDEDDAWTGRIGARIQYTAQTPEALWQPYAKVNLWHTFSGTDRVSFGGGEPLASRFGQTALEVGAGVTARVTQNLSFYGNADYRWSIDGETRETAIQGTIGIRFNW